MKVTCGRCKRRIKARKGGAECRCGAWIDPFRRGYYETRFREMRFESIREVAGTILRADHLDGSRDAIEFIREMAMDQDTQLMALLCAVDVLKSVQDACPSDLAGSIVRKWPFNPELRSMMANCLFMSDRREDHLEGFKQRIIAADLRFRSARNRGMLTDDNYSEMMQRYMDDIEGTRRFLEGLERFPNKSVRKAVRGSTEVAVELMDEILGLETLHIHAGLPQMAAPGGRKIVLDTNAVTNPVIWPHLTSDGIVFLMPEEVLIEISNWKFVDRIPLEMDRVKVVPVTMNVPPEIEGVRSPKPGKVVSDCDRKVATLAIQESADAIVTSDCDLLDSGLAYRIEKNWGKGIAVLRPEDLGRWLRKSLSIQSAAVANMGSV